MIPSRYVYATCKATKLISFSSDDGVFSTYVLFHLSSLRMTDRNATVLCLLCHYLKLLQACRLPSVANWSSEFLKLVLDRIREFQQVGGKTRILFYSNLDSSIAG
ncbi:hypothetical protein FBUS_10174 [Fasciolopsis buskii]|uniref:Uncharacterized protein n=1 Tax=Fasciolopsis buskii TaxID=27845 RepID=A0A8E0S3D4_9TREM|nr:hypothetical protein FBUS_10174 [Fasciolopsis buski]